MKILSPVWLFLCLSLSLGRSFGQTGHRIEITIDNFAGDSALIANYFWDKQVIYDTVPVNQGKILLEGKDPIPQGMYLVALPPQNNYFELIIPADQYFSMSTDTVDLVRNLKITGSEENEAFYKDLLFIADRRKEFESLSNRMKGASPEESVSIREEMNRVDKSVKSYRKEFIEKYPSHLYVKVLQGLEEPQMPEQIPLASNGREDSAYAFRYYRNKFLEKIDFADERMLRTPVLYNKINQYLEQLTPKHPDSVGLSIDRIVDKTRPNKEVFKIVVGNLLNKYANSKIMGYDAIYVHMVERYYMSKEAYWVDSLTLSKMEDRAMKISPTMIGRKAPELRMMDVNNKFTSLHNDVQGDYIIVYFWDYDCGHCKEITPKLAELFNTRLKDKNVKLFTISINGNIEKWKESLQKYGLDTYGINVQDHARKTNFGTQYDILSTPRIFLLDKDKIIKAKHFAVDQLEEILNQLVSPKS